VTSIGACAGSRKGADAGGGATTGGVSALDTTTASAPAGPAPTGTPAAATTAIAPTGQGAGQAQTCDDGKCAPGLSCVSYYGIAGGAGPKFTSCEIRCEMSGKPPCPKGQTCVTIADGPGAVCRPPDM
jgi:hypothetical protein